MLRLQDEAGNILTGLYNTTGSDEAAPTNIKDGISQLKDFSFEDFIHEFATRIVHFAFDLVIAILVFYIGKFIIKRLYRFVASILIKRNVDRSLSTFTLSFVKIVLYFILIVTVIGILGIETSSFLALFASAGVAIGMALSGTLQNFAGGVLILLLKPYKIGDYVEAQGYGGTVREIQIFHTLILTPDNKAILIPNGGLSTSSINNWSREEYRRVTWEVGISYGDDVTAARQAILDMFKTDHRIVNEIIEDETAAEHAASVQADGHTTSHADEKEPRRPGLFRRLFGNRAKVKQAIEKWEIKRNADILALKPKVVKAPTVTVNSLGDSSVNLIVKAWVHTPTYWDVFYDYNERFYNELPQNGINFPFPQMDVHLKQQA